MLKTCIQPACGSTEEFFQTYWHKKPLHSRPNSPTRYDPNFRLADLEFLWATTMKVDPSSMLFFSKGSPITVLRSAFFAFCHSVSIVVNKADRLSPSILEICKSFEQEFPFVFCNVYCTPAGEQTVPIHTDDRDVFVLQVHGAKHWTVFDEPPVVLPYKVEEIGKTSPTTAADAKKMTTCFDGVVECGDCLYLPRGFAHVAKALPNSPSIHLTIAVQTSDWDVNALIHDGVSAALDRMLSEGGVKGPSGAPDLFKLRAVLPPAVMKTAAQQQEQQKQQQQQQKDEEAAAAAAAASTAAFANETDYIQKIRDSLDLVVDRLKASPGLCMDQFRQRLISKKVRRQEYFDEHVSGLRFFPLSLSSLVQWNGEVTIAQVNDVADPSKRLGSVRHCVIMKKRLAQHHNSSNKRHQQKQNNNDSNTSSDDDMDVIQVHVSPAVLEILKIWQEHFVLCPGPISAMCEVMESHQMKTLLVENNSNNKLDKEGKISVTGVVGDVTLACMCVAGFLLRNGCMVRVS